MDAMQVENINWLVPPPPPAVKGAAAAADATPVFAQPWPDPYSDVLDMGPLDPSFTASLEDSIVDPNLLGGFEDASKAVESEAAAAAHQHAVPLKGELSTDTSPDLDFFSSEMSHPSTSNSNRSSSLITPDSLPPALPTPPPAPLQQQQPKKRGRPQKRQSTSSQPSSSQQQQQQQQAGEQEKSPAKRKRRSPQKPAPAPAVTQQQPQQQQVIVQPDLASSSSSSSIAVPVPSSTGMPEMSEIAEMAELAELAEIPEDASAEQSPSTPPAAQSKRSRIREKNRIAACKCRRKQRKAVSKLTSTHEGLEDLNRQLCGQVSELEAEAYVLKNMLMAHGNCGCEMIQQYFKDAAASLVQKGDADLGGSSASGSGRRAGGAMKSAEA